MLAEGVAQPLIEIAQRTPQLLIPAVARKQPVSGKASGQTLRPFRDVVVLVGRPHLAFEDSEEPDETATS